MTSELKDTHKMDQYKPEFQALVLKHIKTDLPAADWAAFRALGESGNRLLHPSLASETHQTPESLTTDCFEDGISVSHLSTPDYKDSFKEIGRIQGQPVWYIEKVGVYAWGLTPDSYPCLSIWATYPAYPPGW